MQGMTLAYIQPGEPQQNAYIERHNCTVRRELLDHYISKSIEVVQHFPIQWF